MTAREQAKKVNAALIKATGGPLVPHDVKAALGELVLLLAAWAEVIDKLQGKNDG